MKKIVFAIPFIALNLTGWAQNKPERDPFVQMGHKAPAVVVQDVEHTPTALIAPRSHSPVPVQKNISPKLSVIGLLTNSRQPKAIVAGEKSTYIVSQGDQLGDYRVAKIDRSGITLAFKQKRYHCPMETGTVSKGQI